MKDGIYENTSPETGSFKFDGSVVEVFQDMISRSVPGYGLTLEMIGVVAQKVFSDRPKEEPLLAYDLGCSLGASMAPILQHTEAYVKGVDLSEDMLKKAEEHLRPSYEGRFNLERADLSSFTFPDQPQLIISNFTLQFLPLPEREALLKRCYEALPDGGVLLLSEKFKSECERADAVLTDFHHAFKSRMGYSELEISRKRDAIENVLIPEKKETHLERLRACGFSDPLCWYQCFNFASFLAVKGA